MPRAAGQAPRSVLKSLSLPLDGAGTSFTPHGGSGFAQTGHLRASIPGTSKDGNKSDQERHFFVKISSSAPSSSLPEEGAMFRGEFTSLNAISGAVPDMCPRAIAWGEIKDEDEDDGGAIPKVSSSWFLVTEFLQLGGTLGGRRLDSACLAVRLGKLHSIPAPAPPANAEVRQAATTNFKLNCAEGNGNAEDESVPQFGFPVPTFCGDVRQPNQFRRSWADFYANQRLRTVLKESEKKERERQMFTGPCGKDRT